MNEEKVRYHFSGGRILHQFEEGKEYEAEGITSQAEEFLHGSVWTEELEMILDLHENFYYSDKDAGYGGYERDDYDDRYGEEDPYDDDYDYDDDEIGYLNRELWEYEAEFDRAAREIEKSHRSPAAKILLGLLVIAAALAIYLGVSGYVSGGSSEEAGVRVSFVRADEPETSTEEIRF